MLLDKERFRIEHCMNLGPENFRDQPQNKRLGLFNNLYAILFQFLCVLSVFQIISNKVMSDN